MSRRIVRSTGLEPAPPPPVPLCRAVHPTVRIRCMLPEHGPNRRHEGIAESRGKHEALHLGLLSWGDAATGDTGPRLLSVG